MISDLNHALTIANSGVAGVAEIDIKKLGWLVQVVFIGRHGHYRFGLTRLEGNGASGGIIIAPRNRRCAVGSRKVHRNRLIRGFGQRHCNGCRVTLNDHIIANIDHWRFYWWFYWWFYRRFYWWLYRWLYWWGRHFDNNSRRITLGAVRAHSCISKCVFSRKIVIRRISNSVVVVKNSGTVLRLSDGNNVLTL